MLNPYQKPKGVETRWFSPENVRGERAMGGLENGGAKGRPFVRLEPGASVSLVETEGSGTVCRMWLTVNDRSPKMLRSLRIDMFWDGAAEPAVSAPIGDFFGIGLGRRTPFECALFSDPEGRSFNCFIPMPFRSGAKIMITNEGDAPLSHLFYDIDVLTNVHHGDDVLYFHAHWRREMPNILGKDYVIVPHIRQSGRFLGCNVGVITESRYENSWWGEGEVKVRLGTDTIPTLCGTGSEDYIGTAWGQGAFAQRTQGSPIADSERGHWAFYRYHLDDPIYFDDGCEVTIQTIGGGPKDKVLGLMAGGVPLIPVTLDLGDAGGMVHLISADPPLDMRSIGSETVWCNFWRQDDWSSTAYLYLDTPAEVFPPLDSVDQRIAAL